MMIILLICRKCKHSKALTLIEQTYNTKIKVFFNFQKSILGNPNFGTPPGLNKKQKTKNGHATGEDDKNEVIVFFLCRGAYCQQCGLIIIIKSRC